MLSRRDRISFVQLRDAPVRVFSTFCTQPKLALACVDSLQTTAPPVYFLDSESRAALEHIFIPVRKTRVGLLGLRESYKYVIQKAAPRIHTFLSPVPRGLMKLSILCTHINFADISDSPVVVLSNFSRNGACRRFTEGKCLQSRVISEDCCPVFMFPIVIGMEWPSTKEYRVCWKRYHILIKARS